MLKKFKPYYRVYFRISIAGIHNRPYSDTGPALEMSVAKKTLEKFTQELEKEFAGVK